MGNKLKYSSAKCDDVLAELSKISNILTEVSSSISEYYNSLSGINSDVIERKITQKATKYNSETKQEEIDQDAYDYYKYVYKEPLLQSIDSVNTLSSKVDNTLNRVSIVNEAITTVKVACALYEEIPPVPEEAKDIVVPDTDGSPGDRGGNYEEFIGEECIQGVEKGKLNIDLNGDGVPDLNVDTNGDGKADTNIDLNGDGVPDLNVDTNGDGKADINIDLNEDGVPDLNIDRDGDGEADTNIDTNKDGQSDTNVDIDGDGQANTNIDTNGDGIADTNIDLDGDGKADVNVDVNGDGQADLNIDTNGDGIADTNIDANKNGIIDSEEKTEEGTVIPILPIPPIPKDDDETEEDDSESEKDKDKTGEENADDLVDIGEVVIPDIGGEDDVKPGAEEGNKGAGTISNIGTAIADSVTSVEDELLDGVIEEEEKPSIPDALLGGNGSLGMSEFDASGSYKNAQGPAAQAGVGVAGVAALGIAAASGGTAISGVIEENNEESDLTKDELVRRKRIRTIITSSSLVVLSLGFTLTQILRPGSIITILLFGIAILISAVASVFGTNIGKTITTITSLLLLFITFLLAAFNVVSPLGYIIALIALLTVFLVVYIFDLFKEFVDNKVMIPSFVAVVTLNAFGLLKVFNVVNWLIYLLLAALGIAVYLWYERYYGHGFEVLNKLKNEDKRKFFN